MTLDSIPGIRAPFHGDPDKEVRGAAGARAQAHLEALAKRHGPWAASQDGRVRFKNGEDVAYRMVRDGYAVPTLDRKDLVKTHRAAQRAGRGAWTVEPALALAGQCTRALINASDDLTR